MCNEFKGFVNDLWPTVLFKEALTMYHVRELPPYCSFLYPSTASGKQETTDGFDKLLPFHLLEMLAGGHVIRGQLPLYAMTESVLRS